LDQTKHSVAQQMSLIEQGATHFVDVERDMDKNLKQRQAKWCNINSTNDRRRYVLSDNRDLFVVFCLWHV
jgi:hypothetical protein